MKSLGRINWLILSCFLFLMTQNAFAQESVNDVRLEFRVRYVTLEAVYFNGGTADGIRIGDKVWVMRNGQRLLQLEVKHIAEHSASCLLNQSVNVTIPIDEVIIWSIPQSEFLKRTQPPEATKEDTAKISTMHKPWSEPQRAASRRRSEKDAFNGQISLQTFGQKDKSAHFIEPAAYFRFRLDHPAGLPWRLSTRLRSSQNYRQINASGLQKQPAIHRVYEIALEYVSPQMPVEIAAGRLLRSDMRGVGYLDGIAFAYRPNKIWKFGIFAGAEPAPRRAGFDFDEKKIGGFLQMQKTAGKNSELRFAASGIGRYLHGEISRESLTAEIDFILARRLYLSQYVELDLNRYWRREMNGGAMDLSNAYFNATYYPRSWISFQTSYDARRLVRTRENKSISDSLFDHSLRQGWRASVAVQPTALTRIAFDGGWQGNEEASDLRSAGLTFNMWNLRRSGVGLNARFAYFGDANSSSYYPAMDLSRRFFGIIYLTAGGGAFISNRQNQTQRDPWERLRLDANLNHRIYLSLTAENFHGDTMKFVRGFVDLGWRL